jgi:hypothetical protein
MPLLGGGATQSFGSSALGLGVTLDEVAETGEALGGTDGRCAEGVGAGPHAAMPHKARTTNHPNLDARPGSRVTHPTLPTRSRFEVALPLLGLGKRPFPPALKPGAVFY